MCICVTVITETGSEEWISRRQQQLTIWIIRFPAVSVFVVVIRAVNTQSSRVAVRLVAGYNWLICRTLTDVIDCIGNAFTQVAMGLRCVRKRKKTKTKPWQASIALKLNHVCVHPASFLLTPHLSPPHPPHPQSHPTRNRVYTSAKWRPMQAGNFNEK